jgi:hypothetical protein
MLEQCNFAGRYLSKTTHHNSSWGWRAGMVVRRKGMVVRRKGMVVRRKGSVDVLW